MFRLSGTTRKMIEENSLRKVAKFDATNSSRSPGRFRCQNLIDLSSLPRIFKKRKPQRDHRKRKRREANVLNRPLVSFGGCVERHFVTTPEKSRTISLDRPVVERTLIVSRHEYCTVQRTERNRGHIEVVASELAKLTERASIVSSP